MRSATGAVQDRERLVGRIGVSISAIEAFCDRWQVGELALFGSVLRDESARLLDVLLAASGALSFTEGMSFDDLERLVPPETG